MNTDNQAPDSGRIEYLDAVRGIAALAVVLGHCLLALAPTFVSVVNSTPASALINGAAAVAMFFVLSGYVLSFRYLSGERMANFSLGGFYIRRYCRIVPTYAVVLLLSLLVHHTIYLLPAAELTPNWSRWSQNLWSAKKVDLPMTEYLKSLLMIMPQTSFPYVPQAWTLRIEMGMSLLLPFLVLIACRSHWWLIAFSVVAINILGVYIYLSHFVLGILLAQLGHHWVNLVKQHKLLTWLVPIAGFVLYNYRNAPELIAFEMGPARSHLLMAIGSTMLLVWIMSNTTAQRVLLWQPLQFLGRVSYSLYLVHFVVLLGVTPWLVKGWNAAGITGTTSTSLAMGATIVLSIALAALTYYLVEKPSIQLGRSLSRTWQKSL